MRFFHLALLPLAAATISFDSLMGTDPAQQTPSSGSGIKVITDAITSCTAQIKVCSTAVTNLKAGGDFKEVEKAFDTLVTTVETAGKSLKTAGEIQLNDLLGLIPQLQPLATACTGLINDVVTKKSIIVQLNGCSLVQTISDKMTKATQSFLAAFGVVFPQFSQAQGLVDAFSAIVGPFQTGVAGFKTSCGGGSPTGGPTTTTTRLPTGSANSAVTVTVTKTVTPACNCDGNPTTTSTTVRPSSTSTFVPPPPPPPATTSSSRTPPVNGTIPRPTTSIQTAGGPMFTAQAGLMGAIALVAAGVYA